MNDELTDIIRLEKHHIKIASQMLARAFYNDPINLYAYPDTVEKDRGLPYAYEFLLLYGLRYGEAHTTSDKVEGIALWLPTDKVYISFWRSLLSGAILPALKMGQVAGQRMQIFSEYIETKHRELVPFNHWYLMLLGVEPRLQGRGYASRLVRAMLARIDKEGLPCYLETEGERNVCMYHHFGFEVIDEFIIPETKVKLCAMLRERANT